MLDPRTTIANLVLDHSECAVVLARHRIDYCCKGARPLADACTDLGLDVDAILAELEQAIRRREPRANPDPRELATRDLIVLAIAPHHQYLHRAMPYLQTLAAKVARVHGDRAPELREVARLVDAFVDAMRPHLAEEEGELFPALIDGRIDDARPLLRTMRAEHEAVGVLLGELRTAAADFAPPDWACTSYRTLMNELAELEADTLAHIHLENHVLLPRFALTTQATTRSMRPLRPQA